MNKYNVQHPLKLNVTVYPKNSLREYKFKREDAQTFRKTIVCSLNRSHGFGVIGCCIFEYEIGIQ
jgi:hypothetical protein